MNLKATQFVVFRQGFEEYGYSFKEEGHPDTLFDVVLGAAHALEYESVRLKRLKQYQWVADAIVEAAKQLDKEQVQRNQGNI